MWTKTKAVSRSKLGWISVQMTIKERNVELEGRQEESYGKGMKARNRAAYRAAYIVAWFENHRDESFLQTFALMRVWDQKESQCERNGKMAHFPFSGKVGRETLLPFGARSCLILAGMGDERYWRKHQTIVYWSSSSPPLLLRALGGDKELYALIWGDFFPLLRFFRSVKVNFIHTSLLWPNWPWLFLAFWKA